MRTNVALVLVPLAIIVSCGDSGAPLSLAPIPSGDSIVLFNGSFETDDAPSLEGWRVYNPQLTDVVHEAPPDGGNWSLKLTSDWAPTTGFVYAPLTSFKSGDIVRLSAYVRATGIHGGGGSITLIVAPFVAPIYYGNRKNSAWSTDTSWTKLAVTDTLVLLPGDTVWVKLSSFHTELIPYSGLFDLVKCERVLD